MQTELSNLWICVTLSNSYNSEHNNEHLLNMGNGISLEPKEHTLLGFSVEFFIKSSRQNLNSNQLYNTHAYIRM